MGLHSSSIGLGFDRHDVDDHINIRHHAIIIHISHQSHNVHGFSRCKAMTGRVRLCMA
jgi:hypothetical protein